MSAMVERELDVSSEIDQYTREGFVAAETDSAQLARLEWETLRSVQLSIPEIPFPLPVKCSSQKEWRDLQSWCKNSHDVCVLCCALSRQEIVRP